MELNPENIVAALKDQITETQQAWDGAGYNPALVREQVADLAQRYGSPALDVGTGACACLAVIMAQSGMSVMAVDHASSAVRIAQERAAGTLNSNLEVRLADAAQLPFSNNTYGIVTAFDVLCHTSDASPVVKEMFRVCAARGAVVITELNDAGRDITRHLDDGFHNKLPALLAPHCENCQQLRSTHHVTDVCEKK
jgi:ubiquinone/menaquinone biosynthesis C-methylase UbiE